MTTIKQKIFIKIDHITFRKKIMISQLPIQAHTQAIQQQVPNYANKQF